MTWTRRRLLHVGSAVALASTAGLVRRSGAASAAESRGVGKRLALFNLHTQERLDLEFCRGGVYVPDALAAIQILLRDYRNGEQHIIDSTLLDHLYDVAQRLGVDPVYSVISGYRSPETNEQLRERSSGVARHSLHLEGRAIDIRLAGVDCAEVSTQARAMNFGGVGYYKASNFVHLDTGVPRTWNG